MVVFGSLLAWIYIIHMQFNKKMPFVTLLFFFGVIYGFIFSQYSEIETIKQFAMTDVYKTFMGSFAGRLNGGRILNFELL